MNEAINILLALEATMATSAQHLSHYHCRCGSGKGECVVCEVVNDALHTSREIRSLKDRLLTVVDEAAYVARLIEVVTTKNSESCTACHDIQGSSRNAHATYTKRKEQGDG